MIDERLAGANGIFAQRALSKLRVGGTYSLPTSTGEVWSDQVELIMAPRGFCVTVNALNGALAGLPIEGADGRYGAPQPGPEM